VNDTPGPDEGPIVSSITVTDGLSFAHGRIVIEPTAPAELPVSPLDRMLDIVDDRVKAVRDLVDSVQRRLDPVLVPLPPEPGEKGAADVNRPRYGDSAVVRRLTETTLDLERMVYDLNTLRERIEV
jgi:hypothetical protein